MQEIYSIKARWTVNEKIKTLENKHLVVEDGRISYFGNYDSSEVPRSAEKIEYSHGLVLPPFINAHTHIGETLIRGLSDDTDLQEWLYNNVWKLEANMTSSDAKVGTQLAVAEMLRSGTIGFHDQYFYSNEIAEVVKNTGVKAHLNPSIFVGNPETGTIEEGLKRNLKVLKKWYGHDNRIFIGFGPHAPYSVPDEIFQRIHDYAEKYDTTIHTHLQETEKEVERALRQRGMSPIQAMDQLGILDRINAAHCIHMDAKDIVALKKYERPVLHNIQSNLKIGAGIAPIPHYIKKGLNICLGSDGNASNNNLDMLEEVRLSALIHKGIKKDPKLITTGQALKMATQNASVLFPDDAYTGKLCVDHPADLIIVDLSRTNTTPIINPVSNFVYAADTTNIAATMCNGRLLYREGEFTTLDIHEVKSQAQRSTDKMIEATDRYTPYEFH